MRFYFRLPKTQSFGSPWLIPKMSRQKPLIAEARKYLVTTVAQAKEISTSWLKDLDLSQVISFGLPEVDDRYHVWRVPLLPLNNGSRIGEVVIDAYTTGILYEKTTKPEMLEARLLKKDEAHLQKKKRTIAYPVSSLRNTIGY